MRQTIINKLLELRSDLILVSDKHDEVIKVISKHGMMILGEKHNTVNTIELFYKLGLNDEDFLNQIPSICNELRMKYEELISINEVNKENPKISSYLIQLF